MTSTTGSTFSVAVRGQVASCSLPQLAGMDVACKERDLFVSQDFNKFSTMETFSHNFLHN